MAWCDLVRQLSPVFERLRRILNFCLLWGSQVFRALVCSARSAVGWQRDGGAGDEPEIRESRPEEVETGSEFGTQYGAVGERPRGSDSGRPSYEPPAVEAEEDFDGVEYKVQTSDEFYCEYDSSWETDEPLLAPRRRPNREESWTSWNQPASSYKFSRFQNAARDMQTYRHDYPSLSRSQHWTGPGHDSKPNLNFYIGKICTLPDGVFISEFHTQWAGMYNRLERVHSFIQWLFPLPEPGMNYQATPLTTEEIHDFCSNKTARENLLRSYELMLDFYGISLCDKTTGEVKRAVNWRERFSNLNRNAHNNLRITRILKCLGILGYPQYQAPLVHFFLEETLVNGELPEVRDSVLNYFLFAVRDKKERRRLIKFAYMNYHCDDEFVWCPQKIQQKWSETKVRKKKLHK